MSRFKLIQGKKSPDDRILLYNDIAVTFEDVATMCLFFMENEERLYPQEKGLKGERLFMQYIAKVFTTKQIPQDAKFKTKK
tara:strand:- start:774 stop:1016 length:243 start_codon:yes stop_codon:yes gene_type:complete